VELQDLRRPALARVRADRRQVRREVDVAAQQRRDDRVARDLLVQESVIGDFQRKGLTLVSVSEPDLLSDDPSRVLMRQMLGAFFQYEKTLLVAKLRGARQRKRTREGRCEGRKPFGTRPGESEVIQHILALRNDGMALDRIALALNEKGIKSRAGSRWYPTTVSRILSASRTTQRTGVETPPTGGSPDNSQIHSKTQQ